MENCRKHNEPVFIVQLLEMAYNALNRKQFLCLSETHALYFKYKALFKKAYFLRLRLCEETFIVDHVYIQSI